MTQKIGPREQALRDLRAKEAVPATKIVRDVLAGKIPPTSGRKPKKRKAKR